MVPATSPQEELDAIITAATLKTDPASPSSPRALVDKWYQLDTNAEEPQYVLKWADANYDPQEHKRPDGSPWYQYAWWKEGAPALLKMMRLGTDKELYHQSLTETEIDNAFFFVKEPKRTQTTFVIDRRFNVDLSTSMNKTGVQGWLEQSKDKAGNSCVDERAWNRQEALRGKVQELKEKVPEFQLFQHSLPNMALTEDGKQLALNNNDNCEYLHKVSEQMYATLSASIREQGQRRMAYTPDALVDETRAHHDFCQIKTKLFQGRAQLLRRVEQYLHAPNDASGNCPTDAPLVLFGLSGCGKTSVVARVAQTWAEEATISGEPCVLLRFLGTSSRTGDAGSLLRDLCQALAAMYEKQADDVTTERDLQVLTKALAARLAFATEAKPLVVFLDSLDQVSREKMRNPPPSVPPSPPLPPLLPLLCLMYFSTRSAQRRRQRPPAAMVAHAAAAVRPRGGLDATRRRSRAPEVRMSARAGAAAAPRELRGGAAAGRHRGGPHSGRLAQRREARVDPGTEVDRLALSRRATAAPAPQVVHRPCDDLAQLRPAPKAWHRCGIHHPRNL
jgi:hypothetical protein